MSPCKKPGAFENKSKNKITRSPPTHNPRNCFLNLTKTKLGRPREFGGAF